MLARPPPRRRAHRLTRVAAAPRRLGDGLRVTYFWIKDQMAREGGDLSEYAKSMVVTTMAPKELGQLRAADGAEGLGTKA